MRRSNKDLICESGRIDASHSRASISDEYAQSKIGVINVMSAIFSIRRVYQTSRALM